MTPPIRRAPASARPTRPNTEPPRARRAAALAFIFFFAAALHHALMGADPGELQRAFPLYALGGFGILIFGTTRLLIAGMAGRDIVGGGLSSVVVHALAGAGSAGVYLSQDPAPRLAAGFALVWSLGALLHVATIGWSVRRRPVRPPLAGGPSSRPQRVTRRLLEAGSLAYALASAVLVPLAYAGHATRPAVIHVVLVGFVVVTMIGTAVHLLPRFARASVPTALLLALAPPALLGPVMVGLGLAGHRQILRAGLVVEGLALSLFALMILLLLARANRFRLSAVGYAAAPIAVAVGGSISLVFVFRGAQGGQLATHGLLNVYGFVGLVVIAASTDLYGPAWRPGAASAKGHALVAVALTSGGLAAAAWGSWMDARGLVRVAMGVYAVGVAWQLVGIVLAHRRAGRVVSRLGKTRNGRRA